LCAGVFNGIVLSIGVDHGIKLRLVLLTSVEAVPHVIHHRVELVRVASSVISHVHWGNRAILLIIVIGDEHELAKVIVLAVPGVPKFIKFASIDRIRGARCVSNNLEIAVFVEGLNLSREFGLLEKHNNI